MTDSASGVGGIGRRSKASVIVAVGVAVALAVIRIYLVYRVNTPDRSEVRSAADSAAYELERTPVKGLGLYIFDIEQALSAGAGRVASDLRVVDAGHDSRGDLYEITNDDGDYPVCLAVHVEINLLSDSPTFPDTEVTDGHCQPAA